MKYPLFNNKHPYEWNDKHIKGFFGEYRFLSNFHLSNNFCILYDGNLYNNVEIPYQAAKCVDPQEYDTIRRTGNCSVSRKLGQTVKKRDDWDNVKVDIMYYLVFQKFDNDRNLKKLLLDTGNKHLEELNAWRDVFWGTNVDGEGENHLGKILMKVRSVIRLHD